jgi:hypothetical protein
METEISDVTELARRESERLNESISEALSAGYEINHWWHDPTGPDDHVIRFGTITMVKRA